MCVRVCNCARVCVHVHMHVCAIGGLRDSSFSLRMCDVSVTTHSYMI